MFCQGNKRGELESKAFNELAGVHSLTGMAETAPAEMSFPRVRGLILRERGGNEPDIREAQDGFLGRNFPPSRS